MRWKEEGRFHCGNTERWAVKVAIRPGQTNGGCVFPPAGEEALEFVIKRLESSWLNVRETFEHKGFMHDPSPPLAIHAFFLRL